MIDYQLYIDRGVDLMVSHLPKVLLAIAIWVIGFWLAKKATKLFERMLQKNSFSKEIDSFLISFVSVALKLVVLFMLAGVLGFDTASLVAGIAALGFAVGMALQGSLGNFAAGIIILIFRPYRVDDWISFDDKFGKVKDVQIFNTLVETPGNKVLVIPNGKVIDGILTNYSMNESIRMELNVSIPYSEDFPKVKEIIINELLSISKVLKSPSPEVGIDGFESHNVLLAVRPYVKPDDYWDVYYEAYSRIKATFHKNNIKVAYSEGVEMGEIGS